MVAGLLHYLVIEAADAEGYEKKKKLYRVKVLLQPWMNIKEVVEFELYSGDSSQFNSYHLSIIRSLNEALEFVRVVEVKRQMVAGLLYYLLIEAADAKGRKRKKKLYRAKVWLRPWMNSTKVTEFKLDE
ncbi:unnamed protein product [Linum grandiflorum]